jgi:transposase
MEKLSAIESDTKSQAWLKQFNLGDRTLAKKLLETFVLVSHRAEGVFMKRKKYSPEFKREAIELVRRSGASCRQVALEIGVAPNLLTRWAREAQPGGEKAFPGTGSPRDEELARLKRELARVTKERDFLRDAAAYFAKESSSGTR